MAKLTLSVDDRVVIQAKRFAKKRGTSVSAMVESYLADVAEPAQTMEEGPILRSLRGILKKGTVEDYKKHLTEKYR